MTVRLKIPLVTILLLEACTASAQAPSSPVPPAAVKFLALFDQLRAAEAQKQRGTPKHVAFQLTEGEINEYLRYSLKTTPRPGIDSIATKIFEHNYVSTLSVVDFDAVERWRPGTIPSLLRPLLKGKSTIWVDYRFRAADGAVTFSVEKAYYQKVRLPAFLVGEIIQIVAARQPEKLDTRKPLPLPFGLRQLRTVQHSILGEN